MKIALRSTLVASKFVTLLGVQLHLMVLGGTQNWPMAQNEDNAPEVVLATLLEAQPIEPGDTQNWLVEHNEDGVAEGQETTIMKEASQTIMKAI